MENYALVGPSGTGKSHRAMLVARHIKADAIIDDGLLIMYDQIMAGSSAKRQHNRIAAIKASLFMDENRAQEMKEAINRLAPNRLLILGTSPKMVKRISSRLGLPETIKIFQIEEFASEKEIKTAKYMREQYSKHVIPAPTLEVRRSLPGILVDPLQIFVKKKETPGKKEWKEQSVIRPTFTNEGKLTITEAAIIAIADCAARSVTGVVSPGRITVKSELDGIIVMDISPTVSYGLPVHEVAIRLQQKIVEEVEKMTGLQIKRANITVKRLRFPK